MARKRKIAAAVFSLGCLHASTLMALGLGELELESFLNEPLKASVDLLNMGGLDDDQVRIRLGSSDDFDKLGLNRAYFLTSITFEVISDGKGGARVLMSSEEPVLEPYLDFIVEARWPSGRLLREYTVLIDPPVFSQETATVSASERVMEVEGIPPESAPAKKNETVSTETGFISGTRVGLANSDLAPGAMPQRDFNSATVTSPTPGGRYMISRDQTLWEIASRAKPDGASVNQTMLDIQRLNPDAFINGNINRIKAGYIVYLPSAADISSGDMTAAQTEVNEQNAAWREGRDAELYASSGPRLSISAEEDVESAETSVDSGATATGSGDSSGVNGDLASNATSPDAVAALLEEGAGTEERLAAAEDQLDTLERIVSLKDDQIAALQNALAEAGVAPEAIMDPEVAGDVTDGAAEFDEGTGELDSDLVTDDLLASLDSAAETDSEMDSDEFGVTEDEDAADTAVIDSEGLEEPAAIEEQVAVAEEPTAAPAPTPKKDDGSWTNTALYGVGALVVAILGFVMLRRRGGDDDEVATGHDSAPGKDVFSEVELQDQNIQVESPEEDNEEAPEESGRDNRGYGERKHDAYASDVDAADALAEADIYIAYGRHPQAIDLLNTALASEPGNPVYRVKLLEIYVDQQNSSAANEQLAKIRDIGDLDSIARAESLITGISAVEEPVVQEESPLLTDAPQSTNSGPGVVPNPLSMMTDSEGDLEADFTGLEIEGGPAAADETDDLDLSSDFGSGGSDGIDDEELVVADDANGLSTKLDLARAYLDMGDEEGAQQILDEVMAEGSEELKAEARALLDRIG